MEVTLKPEYESMIREHVETGHYMTAAAVIEQGLRLLAEQEANQRKYDELKRDVQIGIDQLDSGQYTEFASGAELLLDIQARGEKRLRQTPLT